MKIYISYFGQMRNFTSNMLPVSTAMWDAAWFKDSVERIDDLVVPPAVIKKLEQAHQMCQKNCPLAVPCAFMQKYREYLDTLDFQYIYLKLMMLTLKYPYVDTIVLMVYEKDNVQCAERPVLRAWFKDNGVELAEWHKPVKQHTTNLF